MRDLIETEIYGNSIIEWLVGIAIAAAVYVVLMVGRRAVSGRLKRWAERRDGGFLALLAEQIDRTHPLLLLVIAIYAGSYAVVLPPQLTRLLETAAAIAVILQVAIWSAALLASGISSYVSRRTEQDAASASAVAILRFMGNLVVWSLALLLILDNLGIDVTGLIAGVGIGGLAIGLAAQRILGDLFSSLSIVLDKPFQVGDFIIFGDVLGTVENIGLKTTRLRSLSGEQVVVSNTDLLSTRIRNYKRMAERRALFTIGVVYQTPAEKLEAIPKIIREVVEAQPNTRFDRAHFKAYGDFALIFEIVYYMLVPDYNAYMDTQQAINLALFRRFEEEEIEFAYPTQTLFLQGSVAGERAPAAASR